MTVSPYLLGAALSTTNSMAQINFYADLPLKALVKFNGNAATIEAKFLQIDDWSERTGNMREWITNRAVRVGKGVLAVDSAQALPFIGCDNRCSRVQIAH